MSVPVLAVRYIPLALPDPDAALASIEAEVAWDQRMRARRTASFGRPYDYSGQVHPEQPMPPSIAAIAARAGELAGHPFDNCLCNLYETGDNKMGFHRDAYDQLVPDSWIGIVSLGAVRTLIFRAGSRRGGQRLDHGSLLLMDRATQAVWEHAVLPERGAGRRVSLTLRRFA